MIDPNKKIETLEQTNPALTKGLGSLATHEAPMVFEFDLNAALAEEEQQARFPATYSERRFSGADDVRTVTPLTNGLHLEQVKDEVIDALQEDDPRINVIHAKDGVSLWDAVAERLDADFPDHETIKIRTVEASVDGLVTDGTSDTHDIRDILRVGDIKIRPTLNLASFKTGEQDADYRIHHRVQQYGSQTDFYRTGVVGKNVEGVDRVFPVLLVYDESQLQGWISGSYASRLPDTVAERAKLIQKAYVLDTEIRS